MPSHILRRLLPTPNFWGWCDAHCANGESSMETLMVLWSPGEDVADPRTALPVGRRSRILVGHPAVWEASCGFSLFCLRRKQSSRWYNLTLLRVVSSFGMVCVCKASLGFLVFKPKDRYSPGKAAIFLEVRHGSEFWKGWTWELLKLYHDYQKVPLRQILN